MYLRFIAKIEEISLQPLNEDPAAQARQQLMLPNSRAPAEPDFRRTTIPFPVSRFGFDEVFATLIILSDVADSSLS